MVGTQGSNPVSVPEAVRTLPFRGRRSRNKVSVGEPADGSFEELCPSVVASPFLRDWGEITLRHPIANGSSPFPGRRRPMVVEIIPGRQHKKVAPSANLHRERDRFVDPSEKRE